MEVCYNVCLREYARLGDLTKVQALVDEMRRAKLSPDRATYGFGRPLAMDGAC